MAMQSREGGAAAVLSTARTTRSSKLCLRPDDRETLALLLSKAKPPRGKRWAAVVVPYDLNLDVLRIGSTNHVTHVSTDGLSQIDRRSSEDDARTAKVVHTLRIPQGAIMNVCVPSLREPSRHLAYVGDCELPDGSIGQVTFMKDGGVQFKVHTSRHSD